MKATQPLRAKAHTWTLAKNISLPSLHSVLRQALYIALLILTITPLSGTAIARDVDVQELKEKGRLALKLIERRAYKGKDITDFSIMLKRVKRLADDYRLKKADKLVDKLLFLIDIADKADKALELVEKRADEGRDVTSIVPMLKRVKRLGESHRFNEANELLDEALDLLEDERRSSLEKRAIGSHAFG